MVHYVVAELLGGLLPQPSLTDLVVRRNGDDVEVLRLPAGDLPASESCCSTSTGSSRT